MAWGGLGNGWGMLWGSLGAWGDLGNASECSGEARGRLGRFGEGLVNAWGLRRGGLGRLGEGWGGLFHTRSASLEKLGRLGEAWECLAVLRTRRLSRLIQKVKTSLFTCHTSHFPLTIAFEKHTIIDSWAPERWTTID